MNKELQEMLEKIKAKHPDWPLEKRIWIAEKILCMH